MTMQNSDHQGYPMLWGAFIYFYSTFNMSLVIVSQLGNVIWGSDQINYFPRPIPNLWSIHKNYQSSRAERRLGPELRSWSCGHTALDLKHHSPWAESRSLPQQWDVPRLSGSCSYVDRQASAGRGSGTSQCPWPHPLCNWPPIPHELQ